MRRGGRGTSRLDNRSYAGPLVARRRVYRSVPRGDIHPTGLSGHSAGWKPHLPAAALLATLLTAGRYVTAGADTRTPRRIAVVAASAAFISIRPEGGVILFCTFAGLVVVAQALRKRNASEGLDVRRGVDLLAIAVILFAVVTMARLLYFGAAFPQPVSAKTTGHPKGGLLYLLHGVADANPVGFVLAVLALIGALRIAQKPTPLGVLIVCAALADLAFVVLAGGDWMEGGRFLVALGALVAVLSAVCLAGLTRRGLAASVAVVLVALQIGGMFRFAAQPHDRLARMGGSNFGFVGRHKLELV